MHREHKGGSAISGFVAGALTTLAVGGYYLYGKDGKENRRKVGRFISKARAEILNKMGEIQDITEDKYYDIVDEVSEKYADAKEITLEQAENLKKNFREKWDYMRYMAQKAKERAETEVDLEDM